MTQAPLHMRTPRFLQLQQDDTAAVRAELAAGLQASAAFTHPKYLYDALGSRLFAAITELPEYYPTRTEAGIFARHAAGMAALLPPGLTLVDLGAGNCEKAARLFEVLRPARYVAVDISVAFLQAAMQSLQRQHPALDMVGVGLDFSAHLTLPLEAGAGQRLLLSGVALASVTGAVVALILSVAPEAQLRGMLFWLIGDLAGAGDWRLPWLALLVALLAITPQARALNVLARGELIAASLGVNVRRLRLTVLAVAALGTAAAVATAGTIGFVGLIAPHMVRLAIGNDQRILLPAAALFGGALLLLADTLARTVAAPMQLPTGALMALIGAPVLLALLWKREHGH